MEDNAKILNEATMQAKEPLDIDSRFTSHICDAQGVQDMRKIRSVTRMLAHEINKLCPFGRERSTALTQLSFVMMSANSAIAQKYPVDSKEFQNEEGS